MYIPSIYGFDTLFTPFTGAPADYLARMVPYLSIYGSSSLVTNYLVDLSAEELHIVATQHAINMASLTNEEAGILLDIASKRLVDATDRAAREYLRHAKISGVSAQSAIMDAKIAALDADRSALVTMQAEVDLAIDRQALRVKELTAKISIQSVETAMVEAEIIQKELEVAKAQLEELRTYQRVIEYQIQVTDASVELQRVPAEVAQLRADRAEYVVRKANLGAQKIELDAQTISLQAEFEALNAKINLSESDRVDSEFRKAGVDTHVLELKAQSSTLLAQIDSSRAKLQEIDAMIASTSSKISATTAKIAEASYEIAKVDVDVKTANANAQQHLSTKSLVGESAALLSKVEKEISVWPEKTAALNARISLLGNESRMYSGALLTSTEQVFDARKEIGSHSTTTQITRIEGEAEISEIQASAHKDISDARSDAAKEEADGDIDSADYSAKIFKEEADAQSGIAWSHVVAARDLAAAEVESKVNHSISGGR